MPSKSRNSVSKIRVKKAIVSTKNESHLAFRTEVPPNFEYTIVVNGVEISRLDINLTVVSPIALTGKVYASTALPFYIEIRASLTSPVGSGTFQLKYLPKDKEVFAQPQQFTFENSGKGGIFLDDVKLPS